LEGPGAGGENMAEAVGMTDTAATAAQEIGYQGGKSVWAEAENQLGVRMKEAFENLGGGDPKVAEALQTYNTDRLKDMIVADPAKYGLPADIDFNKMSVDQLKSIEWDKAFTDVFGSSELTENLTPEQVESIVGNNAALREALQESMKMPDAESLVENAASTEAYDEFVKDWEDRIQGVISESQEIYDQYPEFKSLSSVDQINGKIISLQDQINDMKVGATPEDRAMIGEQMQKLSHLNELRANYEELYYKAFYSFTDYGNIDRSLLETDAGEYVKNHGQDKMVKIFESLKSTLSPEKIKELKLEPQSGEKTIEWSRRVTTYIMKNMAQK